MKTHADSHGRAQGCNGVALGEDYELRAEQGAAEFAERQRRMEIYAAWVRSGGTLQNLAAVLAAVDAGLFDPAAFPDEDGAEEAERRWRLCDRCQRRRVSLHHEDGLCSDCRARLGKKRRAAEGRVQGCATAS